MTAWTCTCGAVSNSPRNHCGKPMTPKAPKGAEQPATRIQLAFGRNSARRPKR